MPTAAPDLNMVNGSVSFQVASNTTSNVVNPSNFELVKGPTPIFDDQRQIHIAPVNPQKFKEDLKIAKDKSSDNNNSNFMQV